MICEKRNGTNFTALNIGVFSSIKEYVYDPERIPGVFPGKLFLRDELHLSGMEVSFNSLAPGASMPFIHKHQNHEELFICLGGAGELQLNGEIVGIKEGSCVRIASETERVWRNCGEEELLFIVVQAKENSITVSEGEDGLLVDKSLVW